jgi:hypothetical protein
MPKKTWQKEPEDDDLSPTRQNRSRKAVEQVLRQSTETSRVSSRSQSESGDDHRHGVQPCPMSVSMNAEVGAVSELAWRTHAEHTGAHPFAKRPCSLFQVARTSNRIGAALVLKSSLREFSI